MYVMRITEDTAEFIGKHFNDGVVPDRGDNTNFFLIGDDDTPNKIVSMDEFVMDYDFAAVPKSHLFKIT